MWVASGRGRRGRLWNVGSGQCAWSPRTPVWVSVLHRQTHGPETPVPARRPAPDVPARPYHKRWACPREGGRSHLGSSYEGTGS